MKKITRTGIILAAVLLLLCGYHQYKNHSMTEEIAGKIIRFHVRANSDAPLDQELKLKVRDAIGASMQPVLSGVSDIEKSRRIITDHLFGIEKEAERVISEEGYDYPVRAELAVVDFPEKTYGNYTFPAGKYEALEVVIGEGKGQNWWEIFLWFSIFCILSLSADLCCIRLLCWYWYGCCRKVRNSG